jgi:acyl-CoA thioesterase-1
MSPVYSCVVVTRRRVRTTTTLLATIVVSSVLLAGCSSSDRLSAGMTISSTGGAAGQPVVVAIGDSIMKGHGLTGSQAWPALIAKDNGWALTNLACDGAGFVTAGDANDCADDFAGLVAQAVKLNPRLILISGSSNDLGVDNNRLLPQTQSVIGALHSALPGATIVGISAVWNDTAAPDQVNDINDQMRSAIKLARGTYLDVGQPLAGHREWLQGDDVHPTATGQQVLATRIAAAIRSAKVTL